MKNPIFNNEGELLGYETIPTYQEQMDDYYSSQYDEDNDGPGRGRDVCQCGDWFNVKEGKVFNNELFCPLCVDEIENQK